VKSAFDGPLTGKDLIPISERRQQPLAHRGPGEEAGRRRGGLGGADSEVSPLVRSKHAGGTR